ncbi:hypothetical protein [Phaffia rhodozyma]|uniref:Stealth protein CR3 conserved region 3 domain-containing protein n=1 Tax=Phaffia rhodozyma TaxID=264483 RepID=A0A0F7SF33_PHARH|nr:hypothetical protein [Phaffia rhodozyma]
MQRSIRLASDASSVFGSLSSNSNEHGQTKWSFLAFRSKTTRLVILAFALSSTVLFILLSLTDALSALDVMSSPFTSLRPSGQSTIPTLPGALQTDEADEDGSYSEDIEEESPEKSVSEGSEDTHSQPYILPDFFTKPTLAGMSSRNLKENYHIFKPNKPSRRARAKDWKSIIEVPILDDDCLESWVGNGQICSKEAIAAAPVEIDVVWTWVNGSDPSWLSQYIHFSQPNITKLRYDSGAPPTKHFRNKDELRHSLRSIADNMAPENKVRRLHLVLGDWALDKEDGQELLQRLGEQPDQTVGPVSPDREWRIGQIPGWLRTSLVGIEEDGISVHIHHHANIFVDRTSTGTLEEAQLYRSRTLPSFNSFSIEGQLLNIPGIAPYFIYFNDDFFLTRNHGRQDWVTPITGPVLRLAVPSWIQSAEFPPTACPHEWSALLRSNWLLKKRFGDRKRPGLEHIPKPISVPMMDEVANTWPEDFALSSKRRFREVDSGATPESRIGDIHAIYLSTLLLVERSRESMLYTWAVLKMGGEDGIWGPTARNEIKRLFALAPNSKQSIMVPGVTKAVRPWFGWNKLKESILGMDSELPMATSLQWSSLDGSLPKGKHRGSSARCTVDLGKCFGPFWTMKMNTTAENAFKRLTFLYPECGECILSALVRDSGPKGIASILPDRNATFIPTQILKKEIQPHMPLTKEWRPTDFSREAVITGTVEDEPVNLRKWALRLIARYQYSTGENEFEFSMIHNPDDLKATNDRLTHNKGISSFVLNDDLEGPPDVLDVSIRLIRSFLENRWHLKAWWERSGWTDESGGSHHSVSIRSPHQI